MSDIMDVFTDEVKEEGFIEKYIISNMPIFLLVFANIGIMAADYRAYDVLLQLTGEAWKALLAVLFSCALPFVLWEMAWQYKYATEQWRKLALFMAFLAFATSIVYGIADYVLVNGQVVSNDILTAGAVVLTGVHIISALLYFYNEPSQARRRLHSQQKAKIADAKSVANLANSLLAEAKTINANKQVLIDTFGEQDVKRMLDLLAGKTRVEQPAETKNPTNGGMR